MVLMCVCVYMFIGCLERVASRLKFMMEDPGATTKCVIARVKATIHSDDTADRLAHTTSLPVQGLMVWGFEG